MRVADEKEKARSGRCEKPKLWQSDVKILNDWKLPEGCRAGMDPQTNSSSVALWGSGAYF